MTQHSITRTTFARIPTRHGDFHLYHYLNTEDDKEHLAFVYGTVAGDDVLARVHSECFTGDVMGSLRCDCGEQLNRALAQIARAGRGVVIYLRQAGKSGLPDYPSRAHEPFIARCANLHPSRSGSVR